MNHSFSHKYIRSWVIPIWIKRLVSTRTRGALGDNAYRTNVGRSVASPPQYRRLGLCAKGSTKRGSFFGKCQRYDPQYEMLTVQGCLLTMNPIGMSRFNSHFTSFGNPGIKSDAILGNSLRGCMVVNGSFFSRPADSPPFRSLPGVAFLVQQKHGESNPVLHYGARVASRRTH